MSGITKSITKHKYKSVNIEKAGFLVYAGVLLLSRLTNNTILVNTAASLSFLLMVVLMSREIMTMLYYANPVIFDKLNSYKYNGGKLSFIIPDIKRLSYYNEYNCKDVVEYTKKCFPEFILKMLAYSFGYNMLF